MKRIKMTKIENVATYLTKITQVRDELGVVGEVVVESEFVRTALNGVTKQWVIFVEENIARENLPKWDRLWDDFIQEETQKGYVQGSSSSGNNEENVALAAKGKKKSKKGSKGGYKQKGEGKKDMRKFKCFACHKFGHYVGQCPNKKKKQTTTSIDVEDFSHGFEKEYSLLVCLSSRETSTNVWYIDSEASRHIKGDREYFTNLTEIGDIEVVPGNDSVVKVFGSGTISFQRQSLSPMLVRDLLYVPSLKKNLISVSTIDDRGYEVLFHDGKVLLYPKGSSISSAKVIGI
jgi:hypothetical protein